MNPQLDPQTREALSALDQPPPGVEDRLFAAILQRTGGGGGGDGGGDGGGTQLPIGGGESALAYAAKVVGATLGLTAAGFALVAASAVAVRSLRDTPERTPAAIASPAEVAGPNLDSAPQPPAASAPTLADDPLAPAPARQVSAPARKPGDVAQPTPTTSPAPTLEAELALLGVARRAAPDVALAALERHRVEFEHGVLADEREVLRVETMCALGRVSEAEVIAATFLAARPSSPLRSRVEPGCKKF